MKIKHYIYIRTKVHNKNRILMKFYKMGINVYDILEKNEYLYLKVLKDDYEKIEEKIINAKFYYVSDSGVFQIKRRITPIKIFCIVLFLFFTNLFSNIIVDVDVIHSNKEIRELVKNALEEEGVSAFTRKKEYQDLQKIKEKILVSYKDRLEWLEIENIGMKYIVRIEERIINNYENSNDFCHVIASKSGIVTNIVSTHGEIVAEKGKYVTEGDILISGEIKYNEETKNNVCADGEVLAEVWYQTTVHLPLDYTTTTRTGKKRNNFAIETGNGKYKILKSRLENYETEEKVLFRLFNFTFYKYIEHEVIKENYKYNLESGLDKALLLADEKMKLDLGKNGTIKTRKVLKKSINDSTIDVEVFYSVIENIGKKENYTITEEKNVKRG